MPPQQSSIKRATLISTLLFIASLTLTTHARIFTLQTPSQNGVIITATIDTDQKQLTYDFDLNNLPFDYEQIAFSPAPLPAFSGIPLQAGAVSSPGSTEWNFHQIFDQNNQRIGWQLELQYQTGAPPPRDNYVLINYQPDLFLPGIFIGQPGDDNVEVTLRRPPEGFPPDVEDNITLWAPTPLIAIPADFNLDGQVDVADLSIWATGFGNTNAQFQSGDADLNNQVDVADLSIWATHFGSTTPSTLSAPVITSTNNAIVIPQPTTALILIAATLPALLRRKNTKPQTSHAHFPSAT